MIVGLRTIFTCSNKDSDPYRQLQSVANGLSVHMSEVRSSPQIQSADLCLD
jgi:hypothetical protein